MTARSEESPMTPRPPTEEELAAARAFSDCWLEHDHGDCVFDSALAALIAEQKRPLEERLEKLERLREAAEMYRHEYGHGTLDDALNALEEVG